MPDGLGYRRVALQGLAIDKLESATLLLQHRRWSSAYYLCGYAIEIGLKSCISKQFSEYVIPDKNFVREIYQGHDLKNLMKLAGLTSEFNSRKSADTAFEANWAVVTEWGPESRYETTDSTTAQTLHLAVSSQENGIFPWIQTLW